MKTQQGEIFFRSSFMDQMKMVIQFIHRKIQHAVKQAEERIEAKMEQRMFEWKEQQMAETSNTTTPLLLLPQKRKRGRPPKQTTRSPEQLTMNKHKRVKKTYKNTIRVEFDTRKNGKVRARWRLNYMDFEGKRRYKRISIDKTFHEIAEEAQQEFGFTRAQVQQSRQELDFKKIQRVKQKMCFKR